MHESGEPRTGSVCFGPFKLNFAERLLERDGEPVHLGDRSFDLLVVLIESAGAPISKTRLMARVWPDTTIEEVGLRVHISNLRKALRDGSDGARYILTVAGRGYSFVPPLSVSDTDAELISTPRMPASELRLPPLPIGLIGRDSAVETITQALETRRFVTVSGPGGIGKTTVAVTIAHRLCEAFAGAIYFVDLAPVSDPSLVAGTFVSALGRSVQSGDALTGLLASLRGRRALLLIDSCEHLIDTVASIAEQIFLESGEIHILTTSREPLRVRGENVHYLLPLTNPPQTATTLAEVLTYPAARLLADRAVAADNRLQLSDADVPAILQICDRLDGIALALELAAGQVSTYGIEGLSQVICDQLDILTQGRRTAPARHKTLGAMLEWSYDLLLPREQELLRCLSCFSGRFTVDAVKAIVSASDRSSAASAATLSGLVSKSLVAKEGVGSRIRYRLLETTRAYASAKFATDDDRHMLARRHALYLTEALRRDTCATQSDEDRWLLYSECLGDVRAALSWSFSANGDVAIGGLLAQRAVALFHELSLLSECHHWADLALRLLRDDFRGTVIEMELKAALAFSIMFTRGNSEDVRQAFETALGLAERLGETACELKLSGGLHMFALRTADFRGALAYAQRCATVAKASSDPVALKIADALLAVAYHLTGDQTAADRCIASALSTPALQDRRNTVHLGFDLANRARICRARRLWLQGFPTLAQSTAEASIREAEALDHPVTLCIALIWTLPVYFWAEDLQTAEKNIDWFTRYSEQHQLVAYRGVALGLQGKLALHRGEVESGVRQLKEALRDLRANRYNLINTTLTSTLAEGMAKTGNLAEALQNIDKLIAEVEESGALFDLPELLRIRGDILMACGEEKWCDAEQALTHALECARGQKALAWELKSGVRLAELLLRSGQPARASLLLKPIYNRFPTRQTTPDLLRARHLLDRCP